MKGLLFTSSIQMLFDIISNFIIVLKILSTQEIMLGGTLSEYFRYNEPSLMLIERWWLHLSGILTPCMNLEMMASTHC